MYRELTTDQKHDGSSNLTKAQVYKYAYLATCVGITGDDIRKQLSPFDNKEWWSEYYSDKVLLYRDDAIYNSVKKGNISLIKLNDFGERLEAIEQRKRDLEFMNNDVIAGLFQEHHEKQKKLDAVYTSQMEKRRREISTRAYDGYTGI